MSSIFTEKDAKISISARKLVVQKRHPKNSPEKQGRSYYLPIYESEREFLGLGENSLVKAEIARLESNPSVTKPAHEIQAELDRLKNGLSEMLQSYAEDTSIRKSVLEGRIARLLGPWRLEKQL